MTFFRGPYCVERAWLRHVGWPSTDDVSLEGLFRVTASATYLVVTKTTQYDRRWLTGSDDAHSL